MIWLRFCLLRIRSGEGKIIGSSILAIAFPIPFLRSRLDFYLIGEAAVQGSRYWAQRRELSWTSWPLRWSLRSKYQAR